MVPEVIVARHGGMRILGIGFITNMAAGILKKPLNHEEVIETGKKTEKKLGNFLKTFIKEI